MFTNRDIHISRLEAAILDFCLPVTSHSIPNNTVGFLAPRKHGDGRWNFVPILSMSWDLGGGVVTTPRHLTFFYADSRGSKSELFFLIYAPNDVEVSSPEVYGTFLKNAKKYDGWQTQGGYPLGCSRVNGFNVRSPIWSTYFYRVKLQFRFEEFYLVQHCLQSPRNKVTSVP